MKNVLRKILMKTYVITHDWTLFNEIIRKLILSLEVPVIVLIFKILGAQEVVARHSILDEKNFNFLMSDIDFSIVCEEKKFPRIYRVSLVTRLIFMNFGEIELYTLNDWKELKKLETASEEIFWKRIYLIRKLGWQEKKQNSAITTYEKFKQDRGLHITLQKLHSIERPIPGDQIFSDLPLESSAQLNFKKFYSHFLGCEISCDQASKGLFFKSHERANALMLILPDIELSPANIELRNIRKHVLKREQMLTLTSIRVQEFQTPEKQFTTERNWIELLDKRLAKLE